MFFVSISWEVNYLHLQERRFYVGLTFCEKKGEKKVERVAPLCLFWTIRGREMGVFKVRALC